MASSPIIPGGFETLEATHQVRAQLGCGTARAQICSEVRVEAEGVELADLSCSGAVEDQDMGSALVRDVRDDRAP
jgi:hypothetical protein